MLLVVAAERDGELVQDVTTAIVSNTAVTDTKVGSRPFAMWRRLPGVVDTP